jgi:hypothetical protein
MKLPFIHASSCLPVIVPRPAVKPRKLEDGTVIHEAHNVGYLNLQSERGLFDIGFMLNFRQFAKQSAAEQFTILALRRRLMFSCRITFPQLRETGELVFVDSSNGKLVWATIPMTVIVTSKFTVLDLHDQCMALSEPRALHETIEQAIQGCPGANVGEIVDRFLQFKPPHRTDISRALKMLPSLGIVRKYIKVDGHNRRAVFNMRMVAATKSGILRGMIAADDLLRNVDGTEVSFSIDLNAVEQPAKRVNSTSTGRRRALKKADYQSMYHSEHDKLTTVEKLIMDYEINGYLTPGQFTKLHMVIDDPTFSDQAREALTHIFESARTDPLTEIPIAAITKKDKNRA